MANSIKSVAVVASKQPKSAKAQAKKAANIAAAAERLKRLQAQQAAEVENRRKLLAGQSEEKARQARVDENMRLAREWRENQAKFQAEYVAAALAGPHALDLKRWLMQREATYDRCVRFFADRPKFQAPQLQPIAA